ncbi:MAG: SDR family oxidoreductase [Actinobacteria bacterium]|mgnify:FL=1|jgi:NAD(P)-dependent dehydrogenase (short-subunit alcohol dehydrogenase family)|nr:SDR family oxidoreductase [Actinomycetota bacterium]MBT3747024.1 SDR family oxidoreductase [Actinomycetota bacterium]MBT3969350.1 SDR family oxidoreductase [Actinomycetota bacterium]MBT4010332.1 SDR family oxidoreductase [Actinomycetota bacterium]MBT4304116.1 SDR family oxidoreductase [Actinomycetota bacterium]
MELKNKVAVITGGASGIGAALVQRFHEEGARAIVVADRDGQGAAEVAAAVGGTGVACDVADESAIKALVADTVAHHGALDLFVSNAGYVTVGGLEADDAEMLRMFDVHVMAHVYAARYAIPHMVDQGGGWLLNTSSAAGLLTQIGSLHYSVTKHAAVALAEWIQITYGDRGIGVSVLCPQAVETNIIANSPTPHLLGDDNSSNAAAVDGVLSAEELASTVIEALADERFHVLPHHDVAEYTRRKADDVDRWLSGMQRFQTRLFPEGPTPADWLLG